MSNNDVDVSKVGGMNEGTRVTHSAPRTRDAHAEYVRETQQLIAEQTVTLFDTLQRAVATVTEGQPVEVQRDDHALIVRNTATTLTFVVEAITDVSERDGPAQTFVASQARCLVHAGDTPLDEWVLHRIEAGSSVPPYTWVHMPTEAPVTEEEIITLLRG